MNVKELIAKKKSLGVSNKKLAEVSGVPVGTVQKVFSGETESPRYETMRKLEEALVKLDPTSYAYRTGSYRMEGGLVITDSGEEFRVHERAFKYVPNKRQGEYTVDDYMALPDEHGERYELIDGVIYDLAAPTGIHQHIAGFLYHKLYLFRDKHPGPCMPMISPVDVKLGFDDKTMVQPDVLIRCRRKPEDRGKRAVGVPDFVAEVLSPSTKKRDQGIKMQKYLASGVKEYWLIDSEKETVIVYDYTGKGADDADIISIYSFDDKIPVAIWDGKCKIDFSELKKQIEEDYELLSPYEEGPIEGDFERL